MCRLPPTIAHFLKAIYKGGASAQDLADSNLQLARVKFRLGRSDEALENLVDAIAGYRRAGVEAGRANALELMGDIARERSDHGEARRRYEEALQLYERIEDPYSIGWAHRRLARLTTAPKDRSRHIQSAREAWLQIDRPDLVRQLDVEFGPPPSPPPHTPAV